MGKFSRLGNDLYTDKRSIDFVGRRWLWYGITMVLVSLALLAIVVKGFNFGIEFTGGTEYRVEVVGGADQDDADAVREAVAATDVSGAESPVVTTSGDDYVIVQVEDITAEESDQLTAAIVDTVEVADPVNDISQSEIGASWGRAVAERALTGVAVFLILVMLFIWAYFREWKMSIAAVAALAHDVTITAGIYAISGFQVTPSAVTGMLAILGFSLYDTVVVFDKVRENTHEFKRPGLSFSQEANLAVNQTLVRSINTGIVALIPIGAILWVSAVTLGASSLQDLALVQFVGMAAGVYSSVCLAPRLLVQLKSNESEIKLQERRAAARARHADPYAHVPSFADEGVPAATPSLGFAAADIDADERAEPGPAEPSRDEPSGRGRVAPPAHGPMRDAGAGRPQPTRQPRSKRGKK
ncbi:protein translocase subunit SecF [Nocardioides ferulae]|uniref:protein translocase subunit SecF n=1 Tax=Nocardioides ferulae TaxID=2340821 RepID=UPI000EAE6AA1|nr:protein translocase subunit SecF [Nocardioides ferulae]